MFFKNHEMTIYALLELLQVITCSFNSVQCGKGKGLFYVVAGSQTYELLTVGNV